MESQESKEQKEKTKYVSFQPLNLKEDDELDKFLIDYLGLDMVQTRDMSHEEVDNLWIGSTDLKDKIVALHNLLEGMPEWDQLIDFVNNNYGDPNFRHEEELGLLFYQNFVDIYPEADYLHTELWKLAIELAPTLLRSNANSDKLSSRKAMYKLAVLIQPIYHVLDRAKDFELNDQQNEQFNGWLINELGLDEEHHVLIDEKVSQNYFIDLLNLGDRIVAFHNRLEDMPEWEQLKDDIEYNRDDPHFQPSLEIVILFYDHFLDSSEEIKNLYSEFSELAIQMAPILLCSVPNEDTDKSRRAMYCLGVLINTINEVFNEANDFDLSDQQNADLDNWLINLGIDFDQVNAAPMVYNVGNLITRLVEYQESIIVLYSVLEGMDQWIELGNTIDQYEQTDEPNPRLEAEMGYLFHTFFVRAFQLSHLRYRQLYRMAKRLAPILFNTNPNTTTTLSRMLLYSALNFTQFICNRLFQARYYALMN